MLFDKLLKLVVLLVERILVEEYGLMDLNKESMDLHLFFSFARDQHCLVSKLELLLILIVAVYQALAS